MPDLAVALAGRLRPVAAAGPAAVLGAPVADVERTGFLAAFQDRRPRCAEGWVKALSQTSHSLVSDSKALAHPLTLAPRTAVSTQSMAAHLELVARAQWWPGVARTPGVLVAAPVDSLRLAAVAIVVPEERVASVPLLPAVGLRALHL